MKTIVIYCSNSGKTETMAKKIQEAFSADILKVEPVKSYGGFIRACLRTRKEKKNFTVVDIKTEVPDLKDYDMVFLGFPIWMSTIPTFLMQFMKKCDVKDKILIPFCTSKKTSVISSITKVKECCPGANIKEGLALRYTTEDAYTKWIDLIKKTYM